MKKIDIATDHELLAAILQFQLLTLEYVIATCYPNTEKREEMLDYLAQYRKKFFEDEIHVNRA